jgi:hypothetical protein
MLFSSEEEKAVPRRHLDPGSAFSFLILSHPVKPLFK